MDGRRPRRPPFPDRHAAGERLVAALAAVALDRPVVVGLPRGGVIVAAVVAAALDAPLDLVVVRKLGHPRRPELGLGAIAEGGVRVVDEVLVARTGVSPAELDAVTAAERAELRRRRALYRQERPAFPLNGRTVVVVDDGLATGYTALAAVGSARRRGAARVVVAVPVGSPAALALLRPAVDALVCVLAPAALEAVGQAYRSFTQTTDDEVRAALAPRAPSVE